MKIELPQEVITALENFGQGDDNKLESIKRCLSHSSIRAQLLQEFPRYIDYQEDYKIVDDFLKKNQKLIDSQNEEGQTILHCSAYQGRSEVAQLLLDNTAKVDTQDKYGYTALHYAVMGGWVKILKVLFNYGANIDAQSKKLESVLHTAILHDQLQLIPWLVERGATIDSLDENGQTPLIYAAEKGYYEVVKLLLDKGANINIQGVDDYSALHLASKEGHYDIVSLLISQGAKKNAKDIINNQPPIYYAIEKKQLDIIKLLMVSGAETFIEGKDLLDGLKNDLTQKELKAYREKFAESSKMSFKL